MKNIRINNRYGFTGSLLSLVMILLLCSVVLTSCGSDEGMEPDGKDEEPKDEECILSNLDGYRTMVEGDQTREYVIHIPASYDSNTPTPLVINFHGFGDCVAYYSETVGEDLNATADNNNFIVAYPQAVFREKGDKYWEPGDTGSEDIVVDDVYFTKQLIADIGNEYNVDVSRVYAVGYSNGGMMSYDLACTGSDFIAAIGIMSGVSLSASCDVTNASTSIIHFHGIADEVLPLEGNEFYQSIADIVNYWLGHNNIPASSLVTTELNGGDVIRDEYTGGNENTSVVLYTINREHDKEGGHVWFSDDIEGTSPNQILWDFLSEYSL